MKWRPEGWPNYLLKAVREMPHLAGRPISHAVLEAGADAMIEALRKQQRLRRLPKTIKGYLVAQGEGRDEGTLIYIPDDDKEVTV